MAKVTDNLTKGERAALKELTNNEDLVICKADKGDVTVVMNTSQYLVLAHKHLGDKDTYQQLEMDPT